MNSTIKEITVFIRLLLGLSAFISIIFAILWVFIEKRVNKKNDKLKDVINKTTEELIKSKIILNNFEIRDNVRKDQEGSSNKVIQEIKELITEKFHDIKEMLGRVEHATDERIKRLEALSYQRDNMDK